MNLNNLLEAASFSARSLKFPNSWVGHIPFASWIMKELSPKIFVELGTHSGNSYFAFCQTVLDAGLSSKCYAVDTWLGDEHAGHYSDEVYFSVNDYHQENFAGFSRLMRMTFEAASTFFADESVDLLHIDGLHTYEAVSNDFKTWLPKLAPGGVVLFHDTNVRDFDFGVWKLWEELKIQYPNTFEFVHSHGLGVLQLNNVPSQKILEPLKEDFEDRQLFTSYFSSLGSRQLGIYELNQAKHDLKQIRLDLNEAKHQLVLKQAELDLSKQPAPKL